MFCTKCGKKIPDGGTFCPNCGENLVAAGSAINSHSAPLMESISFTENPEREQTTINMHQKMGWSLKSSQEINTSRTAVYGNSVNGTGYVGSISEKEHYVKLVFERDKNMSNYDILKEKYDRFTVLAKEIEKLEASVKKRSKAFYFWCIAPFVVAFLITAMIVSGGLLGWLFVLYLLMGYVALWIPFYIIAYKIAEKRATKKSAPKIADTYRQMGIIADEAEKYL